MRIPKTGSTSISNAFKRFHRQHGGSRELLRERVDSEFRSRYGLDEIGDPRPKRAGHLSALQLKYILGPRFEDYFKFSFVRNPWARMVSRYHYTRVDNRPSNVELERRRVRGRGEPMRSFHDKTFEQFLDDKLAEVIRQRRTSRLAKKFGASQLSKLCDLDLNLLVDFVGRLENVTEDMARICERLGIPFLTPPHRNKTRHTHYTDYYDDRTRSIVADLHRLDIEYFGYEFGT